MHEPPPLRTPQRREPSLIERLRNHAHQMSGLLMLRRWIPDRMASIDSPIRRTRGSHATPRRERQEWQPSPTDKMVIRMLEYVLAKIVVRQQKIGLAERLARPRHRPLDRRLEHPIPFEDKQQSGCATFKEHEHGLTVTVGMYGGPTSLIQLDERSARVLCLYLAHKVEGAPAYDMHWDHAVFFSDKDGAGRLSFAEYQDGILITAEPDHRPNIMIQLDNWYSRALCRDLHHKVEGRALEVVYLPF